LSVMYKSSTMTMTRVRKKYIIMTEVLLKV